MKYLVFISMFALSFSVFAAKDVTSSTVIYVYQPDLAPTEFEFNANVANSCGSQLYRVQSSHEAIASRKFALVLAAYTAGKKLAFHDSEVCVSGRSLVKWVRIIN